MTDATWPQIASQALDLIVPLTMITCFTAITWRMFR
jgi:hypothetical protein